MGVSVRRNTMGIGQAIDLAGEQTYMKDAKTTGWLFLLHFKSNCKNDSSKCLPQKIVQ